MSNAITPLSPAEEKVVYLMRNIKPFERIEIKLNDNKTSELSIVSSSTTKEIYPND